MPTVKVKNMGRIYTPAAKAARNARWLANAKRGGKVGAAVAAVGAAGYGGYRALKSRMKKRGKR